FSCCVTQSNHL
ncbi:Penicillin-binding protein 2D, partial [Haemophilus influenzae]